MGYPAFSATAWPGTAGATGGDWRNLYKRSYSSFIRTKVQSELSLIQRSFQQETIEGESKAIDAYKTVTLTTRALNQSYGAYTTGGDKLYKSTLTERRILTPTFYEFAELFDPRTEKAWMRGIMPDGSYTRNVLAAFERKKNEVCLTAMGAAVTLQGAHVTGTAAFTTGASGQNVWYRDPRLPLASALSGTSGRFDIFRIAFAARLLNQQGAQGKRYAVCSPATLEQAMWDTKITSADYNSIRLLQTGELKSFMGFEWIIVPEIATETLKFDAGSSTTTTGYSAYFYTENAMAFGMANDVRIKFAEIPQAGFSLQVFHEFGIGAIRLDENAIVRVQHVD